MTTWSQRSRAGLRHRPFVGPVFLRIQMGPGEVKDYVSMVLELYEQAHYEYDPAGSWLTFSSARDVRGFVRELYAYAQDPDTQGIDPEGAEEAAAMANALERAVGAR